MKSYIFAFILSAVALAFAPAAQAESWYAGGFGGLNYAHDGDVNGAGQQATYELGYGLGGYVGMRFSPNLRLEGELSYRDNDLDTIAGGAVLGDAATTALMVNVFYDLSPGAQLNPHFGGGVGVADIDYQVGGNLYGDTVLAMQLGAGADYSLGKDIALTFDYRLFVTDNLSIGGGAGLGDVEYWNSAVLVGIRKNF